MIETRDSRSDHVIGNRADHMLDASIDIGCCPLISIGYLIKFYYD